MSSELLMSVMIGPSLWSAAWRRGAGRIRPKSSDSPAKAASDLLKLCTCDLLGRAPGGAHRVGTGRPEGGGRAAPHGARSPGGRSAAENPNDGADSIPDGVPSQGFPKAREDHLSIIESADEPPKALPRI